MYREAIKQFHIIAAGSFLGIALHDFHFIILEI